MATIEPRLMHLLNDTQPSDVIPKRPFFNPGGGLLNLPPLDPDGTHQGDRFEHQQIPSFSTLVDDAPFRQTPSSASWPDGAHPKRDSVRSGKQAHSLQRLLEDLPESNTPSYSLRMILDDPSEIQDDYMTTKKRHRTLGVKDDFVQLPQPLKRQKSTQNVVPPIINGLYEPPPDAAVFPPISSGSFDENETPNLNVLKEIGNSLGERAPVVAKDADPAVPPKAKRRTNKPRKRWTEEETKHLLLGVSRHGVGKWTSILSDPTLSFNSRTAGDLKDRFRTCCPEELRGDGAKPPPKDSTDLSTVTITARQPKFKSSAGFQVRDVLVEPEDQAEQPRVSEGSKQQEPNPAPLTRKSRAHRKRMEDLVELGIRGPFKKAHRRQRRFFTDADDKHILEGLNLYGPMWTKIQRDPKFNLSARQPTDLRDRVRNKYPDIYARIEKGTFMIEEPGGLPGSNLLEPSVITTIENSLTSTMSGSSLDPHLTRTSSREDLPKWSFPGSSSFLDSCESLPGIMELEANDSVPSSAPAAITSTSANAGDMDISRLLLDDAQVSGDSSKRVEAAFEWPYPSLATTGGGGGGSSGPELHFRTSALFDNSNGRGLLE